MKPGYVRNLSSAADTRERTARRRRDKTRTLQLDMRSRLAKRSRQLEREYTSALLARGVTIDVFTQGTIQNLSISMTQIETARAAISRGKPIDDELMRAWVISAQKDAKTLGLKASIVDPPTPPPSMRASVREVLEAAGKI
jgi:hypothetical protein